MAKTLGSTNTILAECFMTRALWLHRDSLYRHSSSIFVDCLGRTRSQSADDVRLSNILVVSPLIQSSPFFDPNCSFLICCNTKCAVQSTLLVRMCERYRVSGTKPIDIHISYLLIVLWTTQSSSRWSEGLISRLPLWLITSSHFSDSLMQGCMQISLVAETV